MIFATKATEKRFRLIMDEYQDSYLEPLTMEAFEMVKRIFFFILFFVTIKNEVLRSGNLTPFFYHRFQDIGQHA